MLFDWFWYFFDGAANARGYQLVLRHSTSTFSATENQSRRSRTGNSVASTSYCLTGIITFGIYDVSAKQENYLVAIRTLRYKVNAHIKWFRAKDLWRSPSVSKKTE